MGASETPTDAADFAMFYLYRQGDGTAFMSPNPIPGEPGLSAPELAERMADSIEWLDARAAAGSNMGAPRHDNNYGRAAQCLDEARAALAAAPGPVSAEMEELKRAIRSFQRADTEFTRATYAGKQPRLNIAGTRYAITKHRLFCRLRSA